MAKRTDGIPDDHSECMKCHLLYEPDVGYCPNCYDRAYRPGLDEFLAGVVEYLEDKRHEGLPMVNETKCIGPDCPGCAALDRALAECDRLAKLLSQARELQGKRQNL